MRKWDFTQFCQFFATITVFGLVKHHFVAVDFCPNEEKFESNVLLILVQLLSFGVTSNGLAGEVAL